MPAVKLTKRNIDALAPENRVYYARDPDLRGFAVKVAPSGSKIFVIIYRPHPGGRGVAPRVETIGAVGAMTSDQARRAASEALAKIRLGADPVAEKQERRRASTVADLIEAFEQEHVKAKLKPRSAETYGASLARLRDELGHVKAEGVTRAKLAQIHVDMRATPYAANRALATWSKLFAWAGDRGLVPEGFNPARRIERYREQGRERFLTADELTRLGDALRIAETDGIPWEADEAGPKAKHLAKPENRRTRLDPHSVAAIRLLILTGARKQEILTAQWSQIDMQRGVLFLPDSKTGRKPVYLSAAALAVLASIPRYEGNPYIIAGAKPGSPRADLNKPWESITRAAGLSGLRLHDLRHSFASVGAGGGLGLPIVGKLLGHTQSATTARYAHLDADPLRRAADKIGAEISAALDGRKSAPITPLRKGRK